MPIGTKLKCANNHTTLSQVEIGKDYIFLGYDDSNVPKNRQNAVMTWYPDRPIWTPEAYEEIREKFMMIKLEGISEPQWLRNFEIIS